MYFTLEQEVDRIDSFVLLELPDIDPGRPWFRGARLPRPPAVLPIEFKMDEGGGSVMPDYFDAGIPVFSGAFCTALREAGVDNFEAYPAIMIDPKTERRWNDYFAVNIVGKLSAADMSKSTYLDPTGTGMMTVFFSELVIDEQRAQQALMFRLAESLGEIMIHENVVRALKGKALKCVRFDPVGRWSAP